MHRRVVDLARGLQAAVVDVAPGLLHRVEARDVDAVGIELGAPEADPVGEDLAHPGTVLHPHGLAEPQPPGLRRFAHQRTAVRGHRQQPVERALLVPAEIAEHRGDLQGPLVGAHHLVGVEVAHGRRQPRLLLAGDVLRVHQPRLGGLVVAPLDLPTLRGAGVAGIAQVRGVALVAEQGIADLPTGAREGVVGPEEQQRVLDGHQRQVRPPHAGD